MPDIVIREKDQPEGFHEVVKQLSKYAETKSMGQFVLDYLIDWEKYEQLPEKLTPYNWED